MVALLGGVLIDGWKTYTCRTHGVRLFAALSTLSALIGYLGVLSAAHHAGPSDGAGGKDRASVCLLFAPLREANFRRLIIFLSSWNFAVNLAAPFFTVYMLKSLGYSMTTVLALTIASQLSNLAALGCGAR